MKIPKIIAVDFDGTLTEHNAFPRIEEPNMPVIEALKREQSLGCRTILFTCREGQFLQQALQWCFSMGIKIDAVNANVPEAMAFLASVDTRKPYATEYWDDGAVNVKDIR